MRELRYQAFPNREHALTRGEAQIATDMLHMRLDEEQASTGGDESDSDEMPVKATFGMLDGVLARCLLNIWGVILYLRLGWVVGSAGIGLATVIMLVGALVTVMTTMSLSAICTNGEVKGGGAYYLISRALGPQFGGSIGILFFAANAVAVALYVAGFAEVIVEMSRSNLFDDPDGAWDFRLFGILTLVLLLIVVLIGVAWVVKVQLALLGLLILSFVFFIVGTFLEPKPEIGFGGYGSGNLASNFGPEEDFGVAKFFDVFAIFFPAVTGIMAGANISGELRNANKAIPTGTLLSIGISTVVYIVLGFIMGAVAEREFEYTDPATGTEMRGLLHDSLLFQKISAWEPVVVGGIFAATLSSALASLVGAPRIMQSLCEDKLFPFLNFFNKLNGQGEPVRAYLLTFVVAVVFLMVGDLDTIAPLITNFFLIAYALINYACFAASHSQSPGWRPSFKYYNKWVSLLATVLCIGIMFLIDWLTALITFFCGAVIYGYLVWKQPAVNWGHAGQARAYVSAVSSLFKLQRVREHVKTFRPSFLCLTGPPESRTGLLAFAMSFEASAGVVVCGNVVVGDFHDTAKEFHQARSDTYLEENGIRAFQEVVVADSLRQGVRGLLQLTGLGKLRANTMVMGFKNEWREESVTQPHLVDDYVNVLTDAMDLDFGVVVVRTSNLDMTVDLRPDGRPDGRIDVWWLADDGGLTLLLPYLLSTSDHWRHCSLRLVTICPRDSTLVETEQTMRTLLDKARVVAEVLVIPYNSTPEQSDIDAFRQSAPTDIPLEESMGIITNGAALRQVSAHAAMVFVTLPMHTIGMPSTWYLAWLDWLSRDLPPCILLRGNHDDVMTFES